MISYAAGAVIVRDDGRIVIVDQNGDSWSLPKGHLEEGETAEEAMRREVYEETGLHQIEVVKKIGEYERFQIGKGGKGENKDRRKHITMFLCTTDQDSLKPIDPINTEAKWVEIEEVADLLTHPKDSQFFTSIEQEVRELLRRQA